MMIVRERPPMTRPTATDLLETPGAPLTRTHLRELGLERRAVDAVFRACLGSSFPAMRARSFASRTSTG